MSAGEARRDPYVGSGVSAPAPSDPVADEVAGAAAVLLDPLPDLLSPETYGDTRATRYFEGLERRTALGSARPSNGHVGVAQREAAALWGEASSIWPIGRLSYVWPASRDAFWPLDGPDGTDDGKYRVDEGLVEALSLGREVLFTSDAGVLAVRAAADAQLWRYLGASARRVSKS